MIRLKEMVYNQINFIKRVSLVALSIFSVLSFLFGIFYLSSNQENAKNWFDTSGQVLILTGLLQVEISGFLDAFLNILNNEEKYPYGPPSSIVREIIDDPSRPIFNWCRNTLFFNLRAGFWFVVIGSIIQIAVIWL